MNPIPALATVAWEDWQLVTSIQWHLWEYLDMGTASVTVTDYSVRKSMMVIRKKDLTTG